MSTHKYIDRICATAAVLSLLIGLLFMNGEALGLQSASRIMGYETRLFDISRVHTIDLVMDDWDSFIDTCENEEYAACSAVIDNEAYKNIAIRAKGNTSLSTVSRMGSDRYSFKIEFDHYESGKNYYGLDKLSLNNLIQDNTMMKDYLAYRLMAEFGANAPLCSFVYITVNGEDWGLYLAVEGLEDGFLQRNYGKDYGDLYKPDSMSFGGGRGNGRDFNMENFMDGNDQGQTRTESSSGNMQPTGGQEQNQSRGQNQQQGGFNFSDAVGENFNPNSISEGGFGFEGDFDPSAKFGGMGSSDVKLQYIDDDPDSYSNIFGSAKTDVTDTDQARLIQSLKTLSEGGDVSEVLDIDQVLRYFVVHNFVVNGDSYTGAMVHNYYLYEQDGKLSMLPWDYNLAFGTFRGSDASSAVNDPIDTPLSVTGSGDRPMVDWIFSSEEYTELYHQYFEEFLSTVDIDDVIEEAYALITSYVEKDPTKFCTYEEFEAGVEALKTFCTLRTQSISGQLEGTIPSTSDGQAAGKSTLVDASALALSDMGTMNNGGGPGGGGGPFPRSGGEQPDFGKKTSFQTANGETSPSLSSSGEKSTPDGQPPGGGQRPEGIEAGNFGGGFPGGDFNGNFLGDNSSQTGSGIILLAASAIVLLAGLAVAFKFRR